MFGAVFGLRSLSIKGAMTPVMSGPAWNGAWRQMLRLRTVQRLLTSVRGQQMKQTSSLHTLRGLNRLGAHRTGTTAARIQRRGFRSSSWWRNGAQKPVEEKLSLSQRLKKLSKEYGWSAVGVYLALSVLDFPFCFLLVRFVGAETIGKIEHSVVSSVKQFIPESVRQKWHEYWSSIKSAEVETLGNDNISDGVEMASWGVQEAQKHNKEEASLGTQLALAYAIHKSFIFLRVPLTAAVTPKVVKVLRSWGWNIGKRVSR